MVHVAGAKTTSECVVKKSNKVHQGRRWVQKAPVITLLGELRDSALRFSRSQQVVFASRTVQRHGAFPRNKPANVMDQSAVTSDGHVSFMVTLMWHHIVEHIVSLLLN